MRKLVLTCWATALIMSTTQAQTLFTYGNHKVTKQEFLKNYQKNEQSKKPDFSEKALKEYLDLYALFRMRVKEAEVQMIDTIPAVQYELNNYRKQLAKNYLTDKQVTEKLLKEAYDRMKEDRHVAHILLMAPPGLNATDSLKLYQRMDSIYTAITRHKADFATLAKHYSEDIGTKDNGGDLGYITALQTLYPFENAVYTTDPGKVSRPFRTSLGFHIIRVADKRPARGEIEIAQILLAAPASKGAEGKQDARKRAEEILAALKKGTSFDSLVSRYSEDKHSVDMQGRMKQFGVGTMVQAFEDAAFSLKKPGDVSSPVETEYGYHIIRLIKKHPLQPFDSISKQLAQQIDKDARAQIARDMYIEKIKQQNGFKEYPANFKAVETVIKALPDTGEQAHIFSASAYARMEEPLFSLAGNSYSQLDFMRFIELVTRGKLSGSRQAVTQDIYKMYLTHIINDFQEHKLLEENEAFRNLMQEYRDGIMLFELMDQQIWTKASKDTTGLKAYYEQNKNRYLWEPGFTGAIYRFKNEEILNKGLTFLKANKKATVEDVVQEINSDLLPDGVTVQTGRYEFSRFKDVPREELVAGTITKAIQNSDGTFSVIQTEEVFNSNTTKSLDDARGYVVAEYQDFLEKTWNETLQKKYPVSVDQKVLQGMVQ